jgi:aspartyl protease family protein
MMKLAAIAALGTLSAAASAQIMISVAREHQAPPAQVDTATVAGPQADISPAGSQAAAIANSADGHFWAEASVSGHEVRFLVDTGASAVALTPEDAERLGIDPKALSYAYTVTTASGHARAAKVELTSVAVAGAEVDNVDAYVIENGLEHSLLGMTYLGRLSQFEATKNALILRP